MHPDIQSYNTTMSEVYVAICDALAVIIDRQLPEAQSKIWHAHPVWFLDGNPIVGYSKQRSGIKLMFWSGESFDEPGLTPGSGKFKDASVTYTDSTQINESDLDRWLEKSKAIQWDYKNVVKRKGRLERLK